MPDLFVGRPRANFRVRSDISSADIPANVRELDVDAYSAATGTGNHSLKRSATAAAATSTQGWIRSADRFTSTGATSAAEGGYWIIDETSVCAPEWFGAFGNGTADDTAALSAAVRWAIANRGVVQLGTSVYRITAPLPTITSTMAIRGAGSLLSWITLDPASSFEGGAIRLSDCGFVNSDWPKDGNTIGIAQEKTGVRIENFALVGNRSGNQVQDGICLYYRCDNVRLNDLEIQYCNGHGLSSGNQDPGDPAPAGYWRESKALNVQIRECGDATRQKAALLINSLPAISTGAVTGYLVNGAHAAGDFTIDVDGGSGPILVGNDAISFATDVTNTRYNITAWTGGNAGTATITPALADAITDNSACTIYRSSGDNVNQVRFTNLQVVWSDWVGIHIKNDNPDGPVRRVYFDQVMCHPREDNQPGIFVPDCDAMVIEGDVDEIHIFGFASNSIPAGQYAMRMNAYTATGSPGGVNSGAPNRIYVQGGVTNGGGGFNLDACANIVLDLSSINCTTDIRGGAGVSGPVVIHANGQEGGWTYTINAAVAHHFSSYLSLAAALPVRSKEFHLGSRGGTEQIRITERAGTPEGFIAGYAGSLCVNNSASANADSGRMYVKGSGTTTGSNTGWVPVMMVRGGTTANRPNPATLYQVYYDTTLGKPVWNRGGTSWSDASGAIV